MSVPGALKRPPRSWVAPRNAAANALSRYGGPAVGSPLPMTEVSTIPATPPTNADANSEQKRSRFVLTPASRAARSLKPVA